MSKYDDERKKIGLSTGTTTSSKSSAVSKYAAERDAVYNPRSQQASQPSHEPIDIIKPGQSLNPLQGTMDRVASIAKGSGAQKARDFVEAGKATRAAQDPSNKFLAGIKHNTVDLLGEGIDRLQVGDTGIKPVDAVGKFINRFGQSAGQAVGVDTQAAKGAPILSTGSKIADKTADIAGSIAGPLTNPSNIGQGLMSGSLQIGKAAAQKLAPKAGPLLQRTIEGAVAGGVQGGVVSGVRGETSAKDVVKAVGIGAALGGAGDAAAYGIGRGLSALRGSKAALSSAPVTDSAPVERVGRTPDVLSSRDPEILQASSNPGQSFKTAKGSTYTVGSNGSTQRTKSLHVGHDPKDVGLKTPSQRTVYVDKDIAREVGSHASLNSEARPRVAIRDDGLYLISRNPKTGKWGRHGDKIPYTTSPEIGRAPVEFWNIRDEPGAGVSAGRIHAGNEIVEIGTPETNAGGIAPRPLPQQPSSSSLGISAFGKKAGAYDNLKTSTKSQLVTRQTKERLPKSELANRAYTQLVDDLHPINRFDKEVERVTGKPLNASDRSHTLALNSRGSDVISRQILTEKQVDSNGNVIGNSLKDILLQLPKNEHSYVDFEDYLVNKHAITRAGRGEKVFREDLKWTPEVGEQNVANYEAAHPEFKQMADEIYGFQKNMVQNWLVDTGLIPQAQADAYFKANPTYIPMKRFFSELEKGGGIKGGKSKKGIGNQSAPVKQYSKTGSERQVISPIESMIENVDAFVKAAKRNESMQAFARNLERNPEELDNFAEFVPETEIMGAQSLKDINATLQDEGIEGVVAKLGEDFDASYRKATQRGLDKDNIVRVMVEGEPKYIQVNDKPLLESITAMGPDASNAVMDFLGKVTGVFKTLTTGVNPVFSLTRNIMRDIPQAYAASKSTNNPITFMSDLAQSAYAIAKDKTLYQEYKNIGGGHSSPAAADRNLLAQSKRQILPQRGNKLKGIIPKGYDKLQNALNAVESAPRIGEFKRLAASGTPEDRQAGLAAANDVTVNFKRRGRLTKQLDKVFPYANAAAQGLDKTARMFKDAPAKAAAKTALAVGLPAMISYAINWDNPDYQKVSKQVKDNFYLLPKGDGTFFKIAKPKELGTVFTDIPERLMQVFAQQDPEAFKGFASQIRTTFLPPGIQGAAKSGGITDRLAGVLGDTVIGPIADVYANKNFMGTPIVPGNLANLSPELQSDAKTSSLSKFIGEKTKTSPKALDYLFRQYTGVLGQLGQPLLSPGGDLGQSLVQQVTADPVFSNDIVDKFYNSKGKQDQAKTDYPITGKLPKGYNDGLRKYLGKITNAMGDIRKQMRAVESNKLMPAAQKREQLRSLQEQINQLAEQGNNAAKQVTK